MPWARVSKFISTRTILLAIFVLLYFLTRVPGLSNDIINPDGVNWHKRSEQFIAGLKMRDFERTYQYYHPGVTLMWVTGVPVELYKQITGIKIYDQFNFEAFDFVAKFSLVVVQLILTIVILKVLAELVGFSAAYLSVGLFTFEPFFAGNSRLYHMDILVTLLMVLALLLFYSHLQKPHLLKIFFAGVVCGFAFLTKSVAIGVPLFILGYYFISSVQRRNLKGFIKYSSVFILALVLITFAFFPALWVRPQFYLPEILMESERVGVREGHNQIFLGKISLDAGAFFYPVIIFLKMSPLILFGVISYLVFLSRDFIRNTRRTEVPFVSFLTIFCIGYMLFMTFATKKLDRYILPLYPVFAIMAFYGLKELYTIYVNYGVKKLYLNFVLLVMTLVFIALPLVYLRPYYFTYTSPIFGSPQDANAIIAQKPFGVGIHQVKEVILSKYGYYPDIGMLDIKPISQIYPNKQIHDARITNPRDFDILVLGVNEQIPQHITDLMYTYEQDSVIVINGLEYWRIYVKKGW